MLFKSCHATGSGSGLGGGAIFAESGIINHYVVSFLSDIARRGDDIYVSYGSIIIRNTPGGEGGSPIEGDSRPCR